MGTRYWSSLAGLALAGYLVLLCIHFAHDLLGGVVWSLDEHLRWLFRLVMTIAAFALIAEARRIRDFCSERSSEP